MNELIDEYTKSGLISPRPKVSNCVHCGEEIPPGEELCIMCYEEQAEWRGARG